MRGWRRATMSRQELVRERRRWPHPVQAEWAERAAIMEVDGGLPREEAEREAHLAVLLAAAYVIVRPAA
jgi:hypothetical protein